MAHQDISLNDRYDLDKDIVLLNGTQALVRLMLMQRARDARAGLNTAGYVTGYRGSPLGAVDMQMTRAQKVLEPAQIHFQPGLNEDLAATALWGSQQAELRGEGKYDGVFGLWYGKGPGVDRSGDVMRHANMAGTSPHGGVVMAMGDDHTGESSTTLHQSDWAMLDAYMPIVSPAGVQEIMDYGLYAWELGRFAGVWVGLKTMKDTIEVTSVVNGDPHRLTFTRPDLDLPEGGLNIRLVDTPQLQEERIIDHKRRAAEAFSRANRMDQRKIGRAGAKVGFVAAGKNWLDLVHAFSLLGIDAAEADRLGITAYKVAQVWPMDMASFHAFAEGLDLIVVVEEKRKLIEGQVKEALFDDRTGRRVYGWHKGVGEGRSEVVFPTKADLNPLWIAEKIGGILQDEGCGSDSISAGLAEIAASHQADNAPQLAARLPYFCAGCPHNTSTKVPQGSRAYAGIGCHYMVQWMDRDTVGFTQMGGEGANWVGEAPFSTRGHVFQNIGDGTYNHSGVQAIRFALMAGTTITYKILFNDAVAMTGGQGNDGDLQADRIVRELLAMGVGDVRVVYDEKEDVDRARFPKGVPIEGRDALPRVQDELSKVAGVSAIVYIQTCAAEKRRRRKRGQFPDPDKRVFINTDVCEGCGDCGVQSNCVSIVPVETELGRKRAIDQSGCNKDFSCLKGFCPSFVTVEGAQIKRGATVDVDTGHRAVHIHCRLAERPEDIAAIRVAVGEADTLIGGDLVVSAGSKTLGLMRSGRTKGVVNAHEIMTGDFTRDTEFRLPVDQLKLSLEARLKDGLVMFDASELAKVVMGDSIFSNMMLFGASWQMGAVPLTADAIRRAVALNGAAVDKNLRAFELGRWAVLNPDRVTTLLSAQVVERPKTLAQRIAFRERHLMAYQGKELAKRYRKLVDSFDGDLREAVALGYHKLLAYKDEYEVARLLSESAAKARAHFDGDLKLTYHLSPPVFAGQGPDGRPIKRAFGAGMARLFPLLARLKGLRGTPFDPFGYSAERRMERALIAQYEADMVLLRDGPKDVAAAIELARLPLDIRGFGPVKQANAAKARDRRAALLTRLKAQRSAVAAE
ncbi:MAG: indolepyruvate ferredoxin oxidoreductase family protein [Loktanella sp.]|nr:indolepyruvate ferredoxin oxidoreductase family protein [Loktanella sp.]